MALSPGERLKIAREYYAPRMTQEHLAKLLGIGRTALAKYETSKQDDVPLHLLSMAATFLKIREAYFFDPDVNGPPIRYKVPEHADDAKPEPPVMRESTSPYREGFGVTVGVRQWRGAMAAMTPDEECPFEREELPYEVPSAFLVGGPERAEMHDVVKVNGPSLEDRVMSGERILFYKDDTLYQDSIVFAESPEHDMYVKVVRRDGGRYWLDSVKDDAAKFQDLTGWVIHSYAVAIIGDPDSRGRNIEWAHGRPLRAYRNQ